MFNKMKRLGHITGILLLLGAHLNAQNSFKIVETFNNQPSYSKTGRGVCNIANGVLSTRDAYAGFGQKEWSNYEIKFKARAQPATEQVQVWAGFREYNHDDRYIMGFRGGLQNNLY